MNISFSELLATPKITRKEGKRRKSLNYTANCVTKQLFDDYGRSNKLRQTQTSVLDNKPKVARKRNASDQNNKDNAKNKRKSASKKRGSKTDKKLKEKGSKMKLKKTSKQHEPAAKPGDSWFCTVCNTEEQLSMTMCVQCCKWVHNECVGLDSDVEEDEPFVCPDCDV